MHNKIRSSTLGQKVIKVVYLGNKSGFHHGQVIEAEARYIRPTGKDYPYPKWQHCIYKITNEDGIAVSVSEDGINFCKGFYPVPDDF